MWSFWRLCRIKGLFSLFVMRRISWWSCQEFVFFIGMWIFGMTVGKSFALWVMRMVFWFCVGARMTVFGSFSEWGVNWLLAVGCGIFGVSSLIE